MGNGYSRPVGEVKPQNLHHNNVGTSEARDDSTFLIDNRTNNAGGIDVESVSTEKPRCKEVMPSEPSTDHFDNRYVP